MGKQNESKNPKIEHELDAEALEEVSNGMMYASIAITDSKPDTLAKIGRMNPWHIEALKMITGSEDRAHKPLEMILNLDMGLLLDCEIDISGITKGGHFLDTQGYIAHNDEKIVLAFRCTTSAFDWLTNFNTTSSAWEVEEDSSQGFSGFCSGFDDFCCTNGKYKPRVHTGFYNNFLAVLPHIRKHIDPLLHENEKPRTLYVVGHSLGAGIATLAACHFLSEEYNWNSLPQRLVVVTAGSPRACCTSMKKIIDDRRSQVASKCRMYRLVKGKDVVVTLPPKLFGFCHLIDPIKINEAGKVVLRTKEDDPEVDLLPLTKFYLEGSTDILDGDDETNNKSVGRFVEKSSLSGRDTTKYEKLVAKIPKPLRDHMPDFYLKPLLASRGLAIGSLRVVEKTCVESDGEDTLSTIQGDELAENDINEEVLRTSKKTLHGKTKRGHWCWPRRFRGKERWRS